MKSFLKALFFYLYNSFVTQVPVYKLRFLYLRYILRFRIDPTASIHMGCFVTGDKIEIGRNSVVNRGCFLDGRTGIVVGENVSLSPGTYIVSLGHDTESGDFGTKGGEVIIEDYVWTGIRSTILPGVRMGRGSVAGAGSVVTKDVDPGCVVAGVPARKIKNRCTPLSYELSYKPLFNTDIEL